MLSNQLAATYAQAIFELARDKNALEQVEKELLLVQDTLSTQADLAALLYHPRVPGQAKKDTIKKVFAPELSEFVCHFLLLLVDKRRETALTGIVRQYVALANKARNIVEAEVTTARALTAVEQEKLGAKLSKVTGRTVILKRTVDQAIIGGVIVKIGDKLIDGSIVRQLKALEQALVRSEAKIGVTS